MQLDAKTLDFGNEQKAVVDVAHAVFDDRGKGVSSFKDRVTFAESPNKRVSYVRKFRLKPGLYQVRVAARDSRTGVVGSATEWIDIPKMQGGAFSMSSLILTAAADQPLEVGNDHRIAPGSRLRFLTYIYNVPRAPSADVVVSTQVLRGEKAIISTRPSRLRTEGATDLSRIPYFAEMNLEGVPSGPYVLQVTATDRATRSTTSQRMNFEIE